MTIKKKMSFSLNEGKDDGNQSAHPLLHRINTSSHVVNVRLFEQKLLRLS